MPPEVVTKIRDLIAAEEALERAEDEFRKYNDRPQEWRGAFESVDQQGKRQLNLSASHFERLERLQQDIRNRQAELRSARAAFVAESGIQFGDNVERF